MLPELKYAFMKSHWGKGLASEFVEGTLVYAQESLNLKKIMATTYPENSASNQVLIKNGFIHDRDESNEDGTSTRFFSFNSIAN